MAKKNTILGDVTNLPHDGNAWGGNLSESSLPTGRSVSSHSSGPDANRSYGRPVVTKRAKDAAKRQRVLDESILKQARVAMELCASISEKVSLMKEQAMVAVFAEEDDHARISEERKQFFMLKRARDLTQCKRELANVKETHTAVSQPSPDNGEQPSSQPFSKHGQQPKATAYSVDRSHGYQGNGNEEDLHGSEENYSPVADRSNAWATDYSPED